jgi:hypothetical protein
MDAVGLGFTAVAFWRKRTNPKLTLKRKQRSGTSKDEIGRETHKPPQSDHKPLQSERRILSGIIRRIVPFLRFGTVVDMFSLLNLGKVNPD